MGDIFPSIYEVILKISLEMRRRVKEQLKKLGGFYADCIRENGLEADTLFGPAYKGIPLSVSAST